MIGEKEIIIRLMLAFVLGGVIGLERERIYMKALKYSAGFRTHVLVCIGAAVCMLISEQMFFLYHGDAGRIAAQVISGIGFLGAGAILREGSVVRGLTTAASLWVVACVGLAVGGGFYLMAATSTFLVLFALIVLGSVEDLMRGGHRDNVILIEVDSNSEDIDKISPTLEESGVQVKYINLSKKDGEERCIVEVTVKTPYKIDLITVLKKLAALPGIHRIDQKTGDQPPLR
ncbi:MAG: MgtC/SapB family protein [Eubacteriales bacterium]|jgi:putative Mg2+ transporter-C (MgtC) family protein